MHFIQFVYTLILPCGADDLVSAQRNNTDNKKFSHSPQLLYMIFVLFINLVAFCSSAFLGSLLFGLSIFYVLCNRFAFLALDMLLTLRIPLDLRTIKGIQHIHTHARTLFPSIKALSRAQHPLPYPHTENDNDNNNFHNNNNNNLRWRNFRYAHIHTQSYKYHKSHPHIRACTHPWSHSMSRRGTRRKRRSLGNRNTHMPTVEHSVFV